MRCIWFWRRHILYNLFQGKYLVSFWFSNALGGERARRTWTLGNRSKCNAGIELMRQCTRSISYDQLAP